MKIIFRSFPNIAIKLVLPAAFILSGCTQQAIDTPEKIAEANLQANNSQDFATRKGRGTGNQSQTQQITLQRDPKPTRVPFNPRPVRIPFIPVRNPDPKPTIAFNCASSAQNDTVPEITAPAVNTTIGPGSELNWERTGHDICGGIGSDKRYVVAICASSTPGHCNPANGFYQANVSPEGLGWEQATPGSFTLNANHVQTIIDKANVASGQTVFFHLRYNFDLFGTQYGTWVTRQYDLSEDAVAPPPTGPVTKRPELALPPTQASTTSFTANWSPVDNADHYRVQLYYRRGSPSGLETGVDNGNADERTTQETSITYDVQLPAYTLMVVWSVRGCNSAGCGPIAAQGVVLEEDIELLPENSFSLIASAFQSPSCVNCHAVTAVEQEKQNEDYVAPTEPYETGKNFGLPPAHVAPTGDCTGCHGADLTPGGSHAVPWQAPPASMDLRGRTDFALCEMAKNPGTLAEDIEDHLLGDPLIIWAIEGGELPNGTFTDDAFPGDWREAVLNWIAGGASCH